MQKTLLTGLSILVATVAFGYNITHPNLNDAYGAAEQAIKHIQQAQQQASKGVEFGGHADKAIELFQQAENELIQADKYNDAHQKK
jgi:peptidoglycan hydrolase CwlO-like protein